MRPPPVWQPWKVAKLSAFHFCSYSQNSSSQMTIECWFCFSHFIFLPPPSGIYFSCCFCHVPHEFYSCESRVLCSLCQVHVVLQSMAFSVEYLLCMLLHDFLVKSILYCCCWVMYSFWVFHGTLQYTVWYTTKLISTQVVIIGVQQCICDSCSCIWLSDKKINFLKLHTGFLHSLRLIWSCLASYLINNCSFLLCMMGFLMSLSWWFWVNSKLMFFQMV